MAGAPAHILDIQCSGTAIRSPVSCTAFATSRDEVKTTYVLNWRAPQTINDWIARGLSTLSEKLHAFAAEGYCAILWAVKVKPAINVT